MPYLGKYCEVALYRHWLSFSDFKPSNTSAYLCFKNLLSLYPFFPGQNTTFNEMPHISAYLDFYPCSFVLFIMLSFYSRRFSREHVLPRSSLDHPQSNWQWQICPLGVARWWYCRATALLGGDDIKWYHILLKFFACCKQDELGS